jgi:hypothetical protein
MAKPAIPQYLPAKHFAWIVCVLVAVATVWQIGNEVGRMSLLALFTYALYTSVPLTFSALGASIVTRQPRNTIGWLMLVPALSTLLDAFSWPLVNSVRVPPTEPSTIFLLAVVANRISWVLGIFPLLFILLLFPTGRPPTQRWNGLVLALIGLLALFVCVVGFGQHLLPFDETWRVANPVGFIPDEWVHALYSIWLQVVLGVLTLLCVGALWVRFKQGSLVERTQIKWIAYASVIFGALYCISILILTSTGLGWGSEEPLALVAQLPAALSLLALPVAIAIAILRYRLFDIDVVIRRTLVYSVLTLTLGTAYFLGVVALQGLFVWLTGETSTLAVVASTLVIAALFGPLRRHVQALIDRRFFRKKYDAHRVLEAFAVRTQQQADLDVLTGDILGVVRETLQPDGARIWLVARKERP